MCRGSNSYCFWETNATPKRIYIKNGPPSREREKDHQKF
jgi:hypothetical protein